MKKYIVKLTEEERVELHYLIAQGQASARKPVSKQYMTWELFQNKKRHCG